MLVGLAVSIVGGLARSSIIRWLIAVSLSVVALLTGVAKADTAFDEDAKRCATLTTNEESKACYDKAAEAYSERLQETEKQRQQEHEAKLAAERKREARTAPRRQALAAEYKKLLSELYRHLNYIEVDVDRSGADFGLYAKHSFLTQYSFDIGPQGPAVAEWVAKRAAALRAARINRVGIKDGDGDETYYAVPSR